MGRSRRHVLTQTSTPAPPALPEPPRPVAVVDVGATAVRLLVAEAPTGQPPRILEEAARTVLLGKDAFTTGRLGTGAVEVAIKALEGFRRIMDTYGVRRYRAVATSAVREAQNRDAFLDRVKQRTGLEVEVIDGSEENRLSYMAVRKALKGHEALSAGDTLLVEVGGGSADISFLRAGSPIHSGSYALGSIRMRQGLGSWQGSYEQGMRLLRRHVHNVVDDIRGEMPLKDARHFVALGGDVRFAAAQLLDPGQGPVSAIPRDAFSAFCDRMSAEDPEQLVERLRIGHAEAENMGPALLAYRELLLETQAAEVIVPEASLRGGLLIDLVHGDEAQEGEDFSKQVLASAAALGERYRYDAPHGRKVAQLAVKLFDELQKEHGLSPRHRLLLEVAALLHDIGGYVNLRGHHKHSQYLLSVSEIFGLSQDDMLLLSNVARYHRRALPQKSHYPYMALDRPTRVEVNKLAAILRLANALDADHLQKVRDLRVVNEDDQWVVELDGAGDLTMERLAALARADLITETFGRRVSLREERQRAWP